MNIKRGNVFIILKLEFQNTVFSLNGAIHSFWRDRYKQKQINSIVFMPSIFVIKLPIVVSINVCKILATARKTGKAG